MITYMTHDVLTAVTKVDEVTVGSVWVYQRDRLAAIERVTVTAKLAVDIQPPRITILHMSGATENVPASRLKTLWENLPAYTEAVERWAELRATVPSSQGRLGAAQAVFDELLPIDSAEIADQADGALSIHDMDAVCAQTGLRPDGLNMFPGTFYELGSIYAPWAAVNLLAARLAEQNPEVILRLARAAEKGGIRCREEYFEDWGRDYWEQAR